jgi:ectoine hydroxylase-related dioxygenase (phytanoyl-CoA dioxygenase family)
VSSAYYASVPDEVDDSTLRSGWLKFGEPRFAVPGLTPFLEVQPRAGRLVLFPSYLWHGTHALRGDAPRMSVPFDAVPQTELS